jgi:hypothetical protein
MVRHTWVLAALVLGACSSDPPLQVGDTTVTTDTVGDTGPTLDGTVDAEGEADAPSQALSDAHQGDLDAGTKGDDLSDGTGPTGADSPDAAPSPGDVEQGDVIVIADGLDDDPDATCQSYSAPQVTGTLPPTITEASGMAVSRTQPGVLWVHNDSGDQARIYAIQESGERLATVTLEGTYAYDWEDMAQGPCGDALPESTCLYVGDIGDNNKARTYLKVHRVTEPDVGLGDHSIPVEDYDTMTVVYPDGPRDCEALIVDNNGYVYLLTKEWNDPIFRLYGTPFLPGAELVPMQFLSEHDISDLGGTVALVTAASYSTTRNRLLVRTYGAAFEYQLGPGETLSELPWATAHNIPVANEGQGEAIAYDATGYWHVSEGKEPPIWHVSCE